jgi:predicted nucleic acid-binding protein
LIAVDCSVAIAWTFADERTDAVVAVLQQTLDQGACVPGHWHIEIANVLRSAVRARRATPDERDGYLADLREIPTLIDEQTIERAWSDTIHLSDRYDLTPYDAAYLELALRRQLPLATLDRQLAAAARAAGVTTLP